MSELKEKVSEDGKKEISGKDPGKPEDADQNKEEISNKDPGKPEDADQNEEEISNKDPGKPEDADQNEEEISNKDPGKPEDADQNEEKKRDGDKGKKENAGEGEDSTKKEKEEDEKLKRKMKEKAEKSHAKLLSNAFADRRNIAGGLCDTSLMAANISQLCAVLESDHKIRYYTPLLFLIWLSLLLHLVFGFAVFQMWRKKREAIIEHIAIDGQPGELCNCKYCKSYAKYDQISILIAFMLVVLNVAISGLGLSEGYSPK